MRPKTLILILLTATIFVFACKKKTDDNNTDTVNYSIFIYGISGCHYCTDFEDELDKNGVAYTFYDVDTNNAKRTEMINKLHAASIPESSIKFPVVDVMIDSVSNMFIQPDYEKDVKPLIGK